MAELHQPLKVFLCHGSADKRAVRDLYRRLVAEGIDAWLDEIKLLPGQNWREEIEEAVAMSHVVLVCLSESSINKEGYVQKEIKLALDKADEMPPGRIFLIPAKLEECKVPKQLSRYQWVDLFDEHGYSSLMTSLTRRATEIGVSLPGRKSLSSANGRISLGAAPGGEAKIPPGETGKVKLLPKTLLTLGDTTYFVQDLIISQNVGHMIIQGAHASDQVMQEDVGILHISFAPNYPNGKEQISRLYRRAQKMNQAAIRSMHLPVIKRVLPPEERDLWMISQWVRGLPLSKHYPVDDPLPSETDVNQILGWAIDVCDALAVLHKLREVHGGVSEEAIIIKRGRGAILIDPTFAGKPLAWKLTPSPFDPRVDIAALGDVLYRIITHQATGREPVRHFNPQIPPELDTLIAKMQDGHPGQVLDLKRALIQVRKRSRS